MAATHGAITSGCGRAAPKSCARGSTTSRSCCASNGRPRVERHVIPRPASQIFPPGNRRFLRLLPHWTADGSMLESDRKGYLPPLGLERLRRCSGLSRLPRALRGLDSPCAPPFPEVPRGVKENGVRFRRRWRHAPGRGRRFRALAIQRRKPSRMLRIRVAGSLL